VLACRAAIIRTHRVRGSRRGTRGRRRDRLLHSENAGERKDGARRGCGPGSRLRERRCRRLGDEETNQDLVETTSVWSMRRPEPTGECIMTYEHNPRDRITRVERTKDQTNQRELTEVRTRSIEDSTASVLDSMPPAPGAPSWRVSSEPTEARRAKPRRKAEAANPRVTADQGDMPGSVAWPAGQRQRRVGSMTRPRPVRKSACWGWEGAIPDVPPRPGGGTAARGGRARPSPAGSRRRWAGAAAGTGTPSARGTTRRRTSS